MRRMVKEGREIQSRDRKRVKRIKRTMGQESRRDDGRNKNMQRTDRRS